MSKQFWAIIIGIIVIFFGVIAVTGDKTDNSSKKGGDTNALTQNIKGNKDAKVTLLEYGDFQCPYCQQYEPTVQQVFAKYENDIKFQFRNFPITNAHPNAFAASRAGEAAALQNKFWEMHDALYSSENWGAWTKASNPNPYFERYAKEIGLNVTQYKKDFASSRVNDAINADLAEANKLGVTGTPTFFLNGKKIEVTNTVESFSKQIDEALAKAATPSGESSNSAN